MKDEIEKLGQIIDSLREKASDPTLEQYVVDWLKDPAYDSSDIILLLDLREIIKILNDERLNLINMLEDDAYAEES